MDIEKARRLLIAFFATGEERVYKRRSTITGSGKDKSAYYILDGAVKVTSTTRNGNERIHYLYRPGELFPVTWLFGPERFDLDFKTFSPHVTAYKKPLDEVVQFFDQEPYALFAVLDQQSSVYANIINLNMGTAEQRLAYKLIRIAGRFGEQKTDHYVVRLPLTIQELGDMVRLTRETAGKIIADFEQKGYLILGRQQIVIYPDKLKKLAVE